MPFLHRGLAFRRFGARVVLAAAATVIDPCVIAAQAPPSAREVSPAELPSATPSIEALKRMIDKGQAEEALKQITPLLTRDSVSSSLLRLAGVAYYASNQYGNADRAFERAFARDPQDLESLQMRGLTLFRLGRPADAIPLLSRAHAWGSQTRVDPSYVLALCYMDTRRFDDARHAFADQYGFEPESAPAYLLTARMLLRRDFVPIAQEYALKAVTLDPQLPLAHELLGEVALAGNHLEEAITEFKREQARDPLEAGLYDRIGDAYIRSGKYQEASQWLQRAVLLEPTSTGPYILLGKALLKQGSSVNALMYLEHANAMDPNNYMTHGLLSQAYRSVGRAEDAAKQAEISEKLQNTAETKLRSVP